MHFLSVTYGFSSGNDFDLWVRRSDVEQALDVLEAVLRPEQLTELEEAG